MNFIQVYMDLNLKRVYEEKYSEENSSRETFHSDVSTHFNKIFLCVCSFYTFLHVLINSN